MPDQPIDHSPTLVVSEYQDDGLWHEVLTTQDEVRRTICSRSWATGVRSNKSRRGRRNAAKAAALFAEMSIRKLAAEIGFSKATGSEGACALKKTASRPRNALRCAPFRFLQGSKVKWGSLPENVRQELRSVYE